MPNLYLVRHGLTDWNVTGQYQGWSDRDLNRVGVAQAWQTAHFFATFRAPQRSRFAAIYSSPLRRAWRTATIIGDRLGAEPQPVPDLREMHGGLVEGLRCAEWQARFPGLVAGWADLQNLEFGWPQGETRRAFRERVRHAITALVARHPRDADVIVVAHGGTIAAYLLATGLDRARNMTDYQIDNCSITHVQFTGPVPWIGEPGTAACLRSFNEVGHLREAPGALASGRGAATRA
ncbi:MAG TPA: histidine phosphatase family protein [Chloroflexia bacterium]|nr:histidine phosphatase family protein [Chloroflexia bacterium]